MGLLALAAGLLGVACGSGGSLSGPSATAGGRGVTIQGTVNGGAGASSVPSASSTKAAGLKVSVVGHLVSKGADVMAVSREGRTTVDMANAPVQRVEPFPATIALLESMGAKNNHKCVSCDKAVAKATGDRR